MNKLTDQSINKSVKISEEAKVVMVTDRSIFKRLVTAGDSSEGTTV